jgi:catechol 2,3-dioxygenase-like lactoylglutathione lyase family enzyme
MLASYPINPTLPATDLERAKRFYSEKLGLTPESEPPNSPVTTITSAMQRLAAAGDGCKKGEPL